MLLFQRAAHGGLPDLILHLSQDEDGSHLCHRAHDFRCMLLNAGPILHINDSRSDADHAAATTSADDSAACPCMLAPSWKHNSAGQMKASCAIAPTSSAAFSRMLGPSCTWWASGSAALCAVATTRPLALVPFHTGCGGPQTKMPDLHLTPTPNTTDPALGFAA